MFRLFPFFCLLLWFNVSAGRGVFSSSEFSSASGIAIPPLPDKLYFAGNEVPLHYFDVRESLERELAINQFWHSQTTMLIKLSHRFFPVIEPILRENGVPDDFKYLCVAESGLQQVVSPAKAVGFWQIIPATAKELGLEMNEEIDERYNIELATAAACTLLKKAYAIYGSWEMAAAAYNMGTIALSNQVVAQKSLDYYDMRLNNETARYVYRIFAFKIILSQPQKYGFYVKKEDLYPPFRYREVVVNSAVASWADFAAQYHINYKLLKLLNPWLREPFLNNKNGKSYRIKILDADFREKAYK